MIQEKRKTLSPIIVKELSKKIKKRLNFLENEYYIKECTCRTLSIVHVHEAREVENEFKLAKEIAVGIYFQQKQQLGYAIDKLIEHLKKHFNFNCITTTRNSKPTDYRLMLRNIGNYAGINQ